VTTLVGVYDFRGVWDMDGFGEGGFIAAETNKQTNNKVDSMRALS
jgi:hypothetical protein